MRKSLSLMLSAALAFGSVTSAYAAPLAKKASASADNPYASKIAAGVDAKGEVKLANPRVIRTRPVSGLHQVKSELKAKKNTALRSATAAQRALATNVNLRGHALYLDSWNEAGAAAYGVYTVPTSNASGFELVGALDGGYLYGSVDDGNGHYYAVSYESLWGIIDFMTLDTYDTDTWELIDSKDVSYDAMSLGSALDSTTGDIYGVFYAVENNALVTKWAKADYPNGTSIPIADFNLSVLSVSADNNGQFWAVGEDQILYKINKTTGQTEAVAPIETEVPDQYTSGGCVNSANNTYLQSYSTDDGSGLVEIDLATGETQVYEFPELAQVVGLYIAPPAAEDKAPAAPGFTVTCDNGSMDVNLTLTMPTTLFDGTPASGQTFSYQVVTSDGQTVVTGSATAGSEVNKTATMTASGMTTFVATVSNATGASPRAKASCYVGTGAPAAPQNVTLEWASNTATLTWDAVTTSSDGGYLDPASVTYTVYDADGSLLAENLQATTFTKQETVNPSQYRDVYYSVKAVYAGKSSEAVTSNRVGLGVRRPPFAFDMTDPAEFANHTVFDANEDGKTWKYGSGQTYYGYSTTLAADDWLFSPNLFLTKGYAYKITAKVSSSNNYAERLEICAGYGQANVAAMTTTVVPATEIKTSSIVTLEGWFTPDASGMFIIGFHAISDADMLNLKLLSYEISAPVAGSAPDMVENISVKRNAADDFKADISFTAPTKTVAGSDLTGNVKVKVLRGETSVGEVSVGAGQAGTLQDTGITASDSYTYTFIPVNAAGEEGKTASVTAFIGASTPATPQNIAGSVTGNTLKLTWDPVTVDTNGDAISSANVTYNVWSVEGGYLGDILNSAPITDTSYQMTIDVPDVQDFVQYGIQAVNHDVDGGAAGVLVAVGPAYDMPVVYSGGESLDSYILGLYGSGGVSLGTVSSGVAPYAGEDYFLVQHSGLYGQQAILTGKIAVTGENPVVQFREYKLADNDVNETVVSVLCDGVTTTLATLSNADNDTDVWNKCKVSLAQFKGKEVQVMITGVCKSHAYSLYDEIVIGENINYDLSAVIAAPATVETGAEFNITVTVTNTGDEDADSYAVNLYRNGEIVDTKTSQNGLTEDAEAKFTFKQTLGLHDGASAEFKAVVVYEADEVPENNESATVTVKRKVSTLPGVTGLAGEKTADGNSLTWDEIVIGEAQPMQVTEDFESGESFAKEFEGWTFVDLDNEFQGGFQGVDLPGIIPGETTGSFFVFDNADDAFNLSYETTSGTKFLATLFSYDDSPIDDWAISPLLTGDAQTISFFARSYSNDYPEKIEVWYTTSTSVDPADFVKVESFGTKTVPCDADRNFVEYTADLPAGAKRFAIRSCATGSFMLMVDDVTYTAIGGFDGELKGYNIYCDGVKLNDAPLTQPAYVHADVDDAAHTYHVTAVYDKGESELSEPVTIGQTGIDAILAAGLKVAVEGHAIVVTGAEGKLVTINAVDGRTIYSAQGDARVTVNSSIYLVTVDRKTVKVIVR